MILGIFKKMQEDSGALYPELFNKVIIVPENNFPKIQEAPVNPYPIDEDSKRRLKVYRLIRKQGKAKTKFD